jgi:hypothetical protein
MASSQIQSPNYPTSTHDDFLSLGPIIQRHARVVFRQLPALDREEAVAEALATGFVSFVRLKARGKNPFAFPSALATFAALHVKNGRRVGSRSYSRDAFSLSPHKRDGVAQMGLLQTEDWSDALADDSITPILDQVCFRLDWAEFLKKQSPRHRQMIRLLALGHEGKWVARKFGLSPGRVTQLRKEWQRQWHAFAGEGKE